MPSDKPVIRESFDVRDNYVLLDLYPIHFAGAALFVSNPSDEVVTISIDESDNGTTYTPVVFATPATAGNLTIDLVEQSFVAILFVSASKYFRVSAENAAGDPVDQRVMCWVCQFPPDPARSETY